MQALELIGTLTGLVYLYFEYRASIWLWAASIVMPAIYIFVYYDAGFYADMSINVYYLLASGYGWAMWMRRGRRNRRLAVGTGDAMRGEPARNPSPDLAGTVTGDGPARKSAAPSRRREMADHTEPACEIGIVCETVAERWAGSNRKAMQSGTEETGRKTVADYKTGSDRAANAAPQEKPDRSRQTEANRKKELNSRTRSPRQATTEGASGSEFPEETRPISAMPATRWLPLGAIAAALFGAMAFVLIRFTDSTVPYGDSFTTALSIVGMWMLAQKYVEQWLVWIAVDVVCAGLYFYKGLYPTACLYALYTVIAVFGYFQWLRMMKNQNTYA